jgi:hypothetical protein
VRARLAHNRAYGAHVRAWGRLAERQFSVPAHKLRACRALLGDKLAQPFAILLLMELVRHARYTARGVCAEEGYNSAMSRCNAASARCASLGHDLASASRASRKQEYACARSGE